MKTNNLLFDLFGSFLRKMYRAETQIKDQLKIVHKAAKSQKLKDLFHNHREETDDQIERLEKIFKILAMEKEETKVGEAEGVVEKGKALAESLATMTFSTKSETIDGIAKDGAQILSKFHDTEVHDLAIACGAQYIETGEITAYQILCRLAEEGEEEEVLKLLQESLDEEEEAYKSLQDFVDHEIKKYKKQ